MTAAILTLIGFTFALFVREVRLEKTRLAAGGLEILYAR